MKDEIVQPAAQREVSNYEDELSAHLKNETILSMGDLVKAMLKYHNSKGIAGIKAKIGSNNRGGVLVCASYGPERGRQIQNRIPPFPIWVWNDSVQQRDKKIVCMESDEVAGFLTNCTM